MPSVPRDFRCRVARSDDEPFLWIALYHAIHVPAGKISPPLEIVRRAELARYVQGWSAEREPGVIAETPDGKRIGAAWVRLLQGDHAGYGHIADEVPELSMAVLTDWRGLGVGTLLLQQLLDALPPRFQRVTLSVSASNPARRLYERLGFRQVKVIDDAAVMVRDLGVEPVA
jgi:ribosomal protein S18 acetylase RimI-like enzyme